MNTAAKLMALASVLGLCVLLGLWTQGDRRDRPEQLQFTIKTLDGERVEYSGDLNQYPFLEKVVEELDSGRARLTDAATQAAHAAIHVDGMVIYWADDRFWVHPKPAKNKAVRMSLPLPEEWSPAHLMEKHGTITRAEWLRVLETLKSG